MSSALAPRTEPLIRPSGDVAPQAMTMAGALGVQMRLLLGRVDGMPRFSMRLFEVEPGGHTPRHAHNYEHEVMILEGQGELAGEVGRQGFIAGDAIYVPANSVHQFRNTGSGLLRFLCLVPTTHDCGSGEAQTPGA